MGGLLDIGKAITSIGSVIPGPWQPFALAGSAALGAIDANQSRQDQKGQIGAQQRQQAERYAALAPFRNAANTAATQAGQPQDYSSDYVDPTNPYASGGSGRFTPISSRYAPLVDQLTGTVANAPDRSALVRSYLADYDAQDAPRRAADLRKVGQSAATLGRIGAGMTTNDLTGVEGTHDRDRQSFATGLINNAVSGTLADRLAQLGAIRGVSNDDLSLQQEERGFDTAQGQRAVGYRTAQRAAEQGGQNAATNRAATLGSVGYSGGVDYGPMAGFYGQAAGDQEAGVQDLLQYLPYFTSKRGKVPQGTAGGGGGYATGVTE